MKGKHNASYYLTLALLTFPLVVLFFSLMAGIGFGLYWLLLWVFPENIAKIILYVAALGTICGTAYTWFMNATHDH